MTSNTDTADSCPSTLRTMARIVLPSGVRRSILQAVSQADEWKVAWQLARLRRRMYAIPRGTKATERLLHYTVRFPHGPDCYVLYKDIFINRVYHFEAQRPNPLILDLGSHIGLSILYFKHIYPQARIIGFEPDPTAFPYLKENIVENDLTDVRLVQAAVAGQEGALTFYSDGNVASSLAEPPPDDPHHRWTKYELPCVRLRDCLTEPVDFLKMNIEGAEWEVLADSEDCLHQVRELVVEYHHGPHLPRTLHKILAMLHRHHLEYVVSDFGLSAYGKVRPPINLHPKTSYCRHIYACRME